MKPIFVYIMRPIAWLILKVMGFQFKGEIPKDLKKMVIIGAPHTAQRDFLLGLGWMNVAPHLRPAFVGKESIFYPPFGWFFRWLGGIPDNRYRRKKGEKVASVVDSVVAEFNRREQMAFGIAPEGTRSLVKRWKTGFYQIAVQANVPIVLGYFDFENKVVGVGPIIYPTDFEKDMRTIMAFYKNIKGMRPELFRIDERFGNADVTEKTDFNG